jgi:predicted Ser/Thr protein kinase
MTSCDLARPLLGGLSADALDDEDVGGQGVSALRAHVAGCDACSGRLEALTYALTLAREPEPAAPADVWSRLEDAIAREVVSGSSVRPRAADSRGDRSQVGSSIRRVDDSRGGSLAARSGAGLAHDSRGDSDVGPLPALEASPFEVERAADGTEVRRFGPYEIEDVLAQGGMGVVYRARRAAAAGGDEVVALKVLREGLGASEAQVRRFRAEAEAAKALAHPGIVSVLDVGCRGGLHYHTMELIEGEALDQVVRRRERLAVERVLDLVGQVALAVDHAHERGVVHRDLKPANILLDADGAPKVTDFGLAKRLDRPRVHRSDAIVGTPHYMAPEQAKGDQAVDGRADVFSLGVILYELLTLELPFPGTSPLEVANRIIDEEPTPPRKLDPRLTPDVEAVVLRALEKDPARRYPSARALADDLRRARHGEKTEARPVTPLTRLRRSAGKPLRFVAGGALLVLGAAGGVAAFGGRAGVVRDEQADRLEDMEIALAEIDEALRTARVAVAGSTDALQRSDLPGAIAQARDGRAALEVPVQAHGGVLTDIRERPGGRLISFYDLRLEAARRRADELVETHGALLVLEARARLRQAARGDAEAAVGLLREVVAGAVGPTLTRIGVAATWSDPARAARLGASALLVEALLAHGDLTSARGLVQAPGVPPLLVARVQVAGGEARPALATLEPLEATPEVRLLKAEAHAAEGGWYQARQEAEAAVAAAGPALLEPARALAAEASLAAGDAEGALLHTVTAAGAPALSARSLVARGEARLALDELDAATTDLQAAIKAEPASPAAARAHATLARLELAAGDLDGAQERLDAVLSGPLQPLAAAGLWTAREALADAAAARAEVELAGLDELEVRLDVEAQLDARQAAGGAPAALDEVLTATARRYGALRARAQAAVDAATGWDEREPHAAVVAARLALLDDDVAGAREVAQRARNARTPRAVMTLAAWRTYAELRGGAHASAGSDGPPVLRVGPATSTLGIAVRAHAARALQLQSRVQSLELLAQRTLAAGHGPAGAAYVAAHPIVERLVGSLEPLWETESDAKLARQRLVQTTAEDPLAGLAWLDRARLAARDKRWDVAVALVQRATQAAPGLREALELEGWLYARDLPAKADPATGRPLRTRDLVRGRALFEASLKARIVDSGQDGDGPGDVAALHGLAAAWLATARAGQESARGDALGQARRFLSRARRASPGDELTGVFAPSDVPTVSVLALRDRLSILGDLASLLETVDDWREAGAVRGERADLEQRILTHARACAESGLRAGGAAGLRLLDRAVALVAPRRATSVAPGEVWLARGRARLETNDPRLAAPALHDLATGVLLSGQLEATLGVLRRVRLDDTAALATALEAAQRRASREDAADLRAARGLLLVAVAEAGRADAGSIQRGRADLEAGGAVLRPYGALLDVREAAQETGERRATLLERALGATRDDRGGTARYVEALALALSAATPDLDAARAAELRAGAVRALRDALAAGTVDADRVRTERIFNQLRADPEVQDLLRR